MSDFQSGLLISVVGILVTFSALLIFIGVIVVLKKLFPAKKGEAVVTGLIVEEENTAGVVAEAETNSEEVAAALAAVIYLRNQRAGQLGASLLSGPGPYRTLKMIDRTN